MADLRPAAGGSRRTSFRPERRARALPDVRRRRSLRRGDAETPCRLRTGAEPGLGPAHAGDAPGRREARRLPAPARASEADERGSRREEARKEHVENTGSSRETNPEEEDGTRPAFL